METSTIVGAVMLSGFIALNVIACYLYVKKTIPLDPESLVNHAISGRFDSIEDLEQYHAQHYRTMTGLADKRLSVYRGLFGKLRGRLDPVAQKKYPNPSASYADIK
jgi:hypothetical protein